MTFQKWHGAGNDFLVADNREGSVTLSKEMIVHLCNRHTGFGADGLILLENSDMADFKMVFYNPDGSTGMMCGNGGRCIVAFAATLGYESFSFEAADGIHRGTVLSREGDVFSVRITMSDVEGYAQLPTGEFFLNTGTRHLVKFVPDISKVDVAKAGSKLRRDKRFAPEGVNVNFVSEQFGVLSVRTFEKGVEAETLACGTGIVASAIAAYLDGVRPLVSDGEHHAFLVKTALAELTVEFTHIPHTRPWMTDVSLCGPAEFVGSCIIQK
ncbi:MAG: diaminopimelate epimerase [Bacteroidales bacterium]|nr:diaminopimelate epimerase [Bacteroidales bacterium]